MNTNISLDEICLFENYLKDQLLNSAPEQADVGLRATKLLRNLMSQDLSKKQILQYLHQQMGITPKSERGSLSSNQPRESAIPSYLCRP